MAEEKKTNEVKTPLKVVDLAVEVQAEPHAKEAVKSAETSVQEVKKQLVESVQQTTNIAKDVTQQAKEIAKETKQQVSEVVKETKQQLATTLHDVKAQAQDVTAEGKEKIEAEAKHLNGGVQEQLQLLKQEILQRLDSFKEQFSHSQKDLGELKTFIKTELNAVIADLSKLGKELKDDVTQISTKHKSQLVDTFSRSKEHTIEVIKKVKPTLIQADDEKTTELKS
jgi:gas vesicle protein